VAAGVVAAQPARNDDETQRELRCRTPRVGSSDETVPSGRLAMTASITSRLLARRSPIPLPRLDSRVPSEHHALRV